MTRRDRIDQIKKQLQALAKGQMLSWTADDVPEEVAEQFLSNVLAVETAPTTTNFEQLARAGVALPAPDLVSDADITSTLWSVIRGLTELRVFLRCTDHLSDRELYAVLWHHVLREQLPLLPPSSDGAWHIDVQGSDPDPHVYLKYYAREQDRERWKQDFPDYEMPAHEDPPFDRDKLLPVPCGPWDVGTSH